MHASTRSRVPACCLRCSACVPSLPSVLSFTNTMQISRLPRHRQHLLLPGQRRRRLLTVVMDARIARRCAHVRRRRISSATAPIPRWMVMAMAYLANSSCASDVSSPVPVMQARVAHHTGNGRDAAMMRAARSTAVRRPDVAMAARASVALARCRRLSHRCRRCAWLLMPKVRSWWAGCCGHVPSWQACAVWRRSGHACREPAAILVRVTHAAGGDVGRLVLSRLNRYWLDGSWY